MKYNLYTYIDFYIDSIIKLLEINYKSNNLIGVSLG